MPRGTPKKDPSQSPRKRPREETAPPAVVDREKQEEEYHCCKPSFDPAAWDKKEVTWKDKLFVSQKLFTFFYAPLNLDIATKELREEVKAAGARDELDMQVLEHQSMWRSELFVSVSKEVPGAECVKLSGKFLCRVFEGPYNNRRAWIAEMNQYVKEKGAETKRLLFWYTTCPDCAKKIGKNYVALLAEV